MIDWKAIMERKPDKSEIETEYEKVSNEYYETFGEEFPKQYPPSDMKDDIAEMRECIRSNKKKKPNSVNNEGEDILT